MAISIEVTCSRKHTSEGGVVRITHIGGQYHGGNGWVLDEKVAIAGMECKAITFWFRQKERILSVSVVTSPKGHKRLCGGGDEEQVDYLFHLSDCPEAGIAY